VEEPFVSSQLENGGMSNVLVMFQADTEHTEQMALAVGVGAVEAEASIRLRRLAAPGAIEVAHRGYGKLQAADLLWGQYCRSRAGVIHTKVGGTGRAVFAAKGD
jgi:hypothetical protein